MITWTSKRLLAGLVFLAQAGCSDSAGFSFAAATGGAPAREPAAEKQTQLRLAGGRVDLRAPGGFCVDPASIRLSDAGDFVILARCDKLGTATGISSLARPAPAMVTVSTQAWTRDNDRITGDDIAAVYPADRVIERRDGPPLALVKAASGRPVVSGLDDTHWRGAFVVNGYLVVLGLFAPQDGAALSSSGAAVLTQLARKTTRASTAKGQTKGAEAPK